MRVSRLCPGCASVRTGTRYFRLYTRDLRWFSRGVSVPVVPVARKVLKALMSRLCAVLPLPPLKGGVGGIPWGMGYPPGPEQAETRMLEGTKFEDV